MKKNKTISFRVARELADALEEVENKTEYLTRLLVDDLDGNGRDVWQKEVKKQKHILNVRILGRVGNAIRKFRDMAKSCDTKPERDLLKREFVYTMQVEKELANDPDVQSFIQAHIDRLEELELRK